MKKATSNTGRRRDDHSEPGVSMSQTAQSPGKLFALCLAHLLNDCYMNYIPTVLPFFIASGMAVGEGAFMISAFTVTSSLLQPVCGYLVDKKNQRWLVHAGTLWMAVLLGLIGIIKNYALLLLAVTLAGFGTAAFHPQASAMVTSLGGSKKGFFQAFFITFGNIGWALTPVVAVPLIQKFGLECTPFFVLPGFVVAILLRFIAPKISAGPMSSPALRSTIRPVWAELVKLVLVVAVRSLASFSLIAFLMLYLQGKGVPLQNGSLILSLMLLMGALGGLAGGHLSDTLGRKPVIVGSLVTATPLLYLFLLTNGPTGYFLLVCAGTLLPASFSVTVVVAQEILPGNQAMAAGLMLGFGLGLGGLGVALTGLVVEYAGIEQAMRMIAWLPLFAGLIALGLKMQPLVQQSEIMSAHKDS